MEPKKIAVINSLYPPDTQGGAEVSTAELVSMYKSAGHDVLVITLGPARDLRVDRSGVTILRLSSAWYRRMTSSNHGGRLRRAMNQLGEWTHVRTAYRLRDHLTDYAPDFIHWNNMRGFGVLALRSTRSWPSIHTLRDYYAICARESTFRADGPCEAQCLSCRLLTAPLRTELGSGHRNIIALSSGQRRRLEDIGVGTTHRTISIVQNDVSVPPPISHTEHDDSSFLKLGFIGRLDDRKGIWLLMDAFHHATRQDLQLLIAGRVANEDQERLRLAIEADTRIIYLGNTKPTEFYTRVNAVIVPSQWAEPFGRVAAEASSYGLPVLASNTGGLPDALGSNDHPLTKLIEKFDDIETWTNLLVELPTERSSYQPTTRPNATNYTHQYLELLRTMQQD